MGYFYPLKHTHTLTPTPITPTHKFLQLVFTRRQEFQL